MGNIKILYFLIFLLLASERIISTFKHKEKKGTIEHMWTSILLIPSYIFGISLALFDFLSRRNSLNLGITIIGLLLILAGIALRQFSLNALQNNWSIHIKNSPDQQLIKTGPYKWIRHPYYLSVMLELLGVSFYFNSIISLSYVLLIHFPLVLVRISLEEKNLANKFLVQYEHYHKETRIFLPRVY